MKQYDTTPPRTDLQNTILVLNYDRAGKPAKLNRQMLLALEFLGVQRQVRYIPSFA